MSIQVENITKTYGHQKALDSISFSIEKGEIVGFLGPNGAGKSTLLGLITGTVQPTSGRVKRGKTVQIGMLDQQFSQLEKIGTDRVREVLARTKTSFTIDGKEHTPAQLLERLGFRREHLSARVDDLSGGQKRRLQLLMLLLSEPNVIVLDEPTNDVDSDMLTAMEDLLDSWPGTLIVVSHDRYLLERVTDQQYAIMNGTFRHVPGGIDQYLQLSKELASQSVVSRPDQASTNDNAKDDAKLSGGERRETQREVSSIERRLNKLADSIQQMHEQLAAHDQSNYEGLQQLTEQLRALELENDELEERWLELSAQL